VAGLSLAAEPGSLYERARLTDLLLSDETADVRDHEAVAQFFWTTQPDVVIHLAAQSLVRPSYLKPRDTIETNVMGTLSVLEAVKRVESVRATVIVTTDKVYRNVGSTEGYREDDPLGGHDPYSASKAMADILASSWSASFEGAPIATTRAGNVIGGGDVSSDRLFPDLMRGFSAGTEVPLRYPMAVRPWQHVLDCIAGYLDLVDTLIDNGGSAAWNFGPDPSSMRSVSEAATLAAGLWGDGAVWSDASGRHLHEASILTLDSSKSQVELGWRNLLRFEESVSWTVEWTKRVNAGESVLLVTLDQVREFERRRSARECFPR